MNSLKQKGQGSLEYLLLIAAAILIASVVVLIMTGSAFTTQAGISSKMCEFLDGIGIPCSLKVSCSNNGDSKAPADPFTLSATVSGGKTPYTYLWQYTGEGTGCSFAPGSDSGSQNPALNCATGKNYPYTVTVTDLSNPKYAKTCTTNLNSGCFIYRQNADGSKNTSGIVSYNTDVDLVLSGGDWRANTVWDNSDPTIFSVVTEYPAVSAIRYHAIGPGPVRITATKTPSCPNQPTIDLNVMTTCAIMPQTVSVQENQTLQFNLAYTGSSKPMIGPVTWWTNQGSVASVSDNGLATGLLGGDPATYWADIHAQDPFCMMPASSHLTVAPADCLIAPSSATIAAGEKQTFSLSGITPDTWTSSNQTAATINTSTGEATGTTIGGTTIITATKTGCTNPTATLNVTPATTGGGSCAAVGSYNMCVEVNKGGKNCVTIPPYELCVEINQGGQNCVTSGNYSLCVKVNNG